MVVDTSAVVALLLQEPEAAAIAQCIEGNPIRLISAANWLESQMVLRGRLGPQGGMMLDRFFRESRMEIVALDADHAGAALAAWERFGKGRHAAGLNLGDCCAYATAILQNQPLLCKGGDFARTDVPRVQY